MIDGRGTFCEGACEAFGDNEVDDIFAGAVADDVAEDGADFDRGELVFIAEEDEAAGWGKRREEGVHEVDIDH